MDVVQYLPSLHTSSFLDLTGTNKQDPSATSHLQLSRRLARLDKANPSRTEPGPSPEPTSLVNRNADSSELERPPCPAAGQSASKPVVLEEAATGFTLFSFLDFGFNFFSSEAPESRRQAQGVPVFRTLRPRPANVSAWQNPEGRPFPLAASSRVIATVGVVCQAAGPTLTEDVHNVTPQPSPSLGCV